MRARPFCGLLWEIRCTKTHLVHVTGFTPRCIVSPVFLAVRTRPSPKNGWNWPFPFSHRVLAHNTVLRATEEPRDTPAEHSPHCYVPAYPATSPTLAQKLKWPSFGTLPFYRVLISMIRTDVLGNRRKTRNISAAASFTPLPRESRIFTKSQIATVPSCFRHYRARR